MRSALFLGLVLMSGCSSSEPDLLPGVAGSASGGQPGASGSGTSPVAGSSPTTGGSSQGGSATGGSATGGSATAGTSSQGGSSQGGSSAGGSNTGGTNPGGSNTGGSNTGGSGPMNKVFSECRLHFGTIDEQAKKDPELIKELDFFTSGWMGLSDTFDQQYVCDEGKEGGVLGKQVPVIVAYVSAFYVKRHHNSLCDCNVPADQCGVIDGKKADLCTFAARYIKEDLQKIIGVYESYAKGYAACYGTTRPIVFEMEPDWYQYTISQQSSPFSKQEAGAMLGQFVSAMQKHLPNAVFSLDISPWVDDNGATQGKSWYSNFDLSKFTFINTSGGKTDAGTAKIRADNNMTWAGVAQTTGKGILADTGYGVNGMSEGHDDAWDSVANLNARIDDGVLSISQYNPKPGWAGTIKNIRSQLKKPKQCL